jgi:hypothetical protein
MADVMQQRLAAAGSYAAATAGAAAAAAAAAGSNGGSPEAAGAEGEEEEEGDLERRTYPEQPKRSYPLAELLRRAGLDAAAERAPVGLEISDIVTCNSQQAGPGALYVCVPSNDSADDGHDWVPEVR